MEKNIKDLGLKILSNLELIFGLTEIYILEISVMKGLMDMEAFIAPY